MPMPPLPPRPAVLSKPCARSLLAKLEVFEISPISALAELSEDEALYACALLSETLSAFLRGPAERMRIELPR